MIGEIFMANSISNNELAIFKFFGIHFSEDVINRSKIYIPQDALKQREKKMDEYRKLIKKNRHASVTDKIKDTLKKGTLSAEDGDRRNALVDAFKKTKKWMQDFDDFFWVCQDNVTTEKYIKEINKDFKELKKKGYVSDIPEKDFERFDDKDKANYCLNEEHKGDRYPSQIAKSYKDLLSELETELKKYEGAFKTLRETAKKKQVICSRRFDRICDNAVEVRDKYKECRKKLDKIIKYDIKHNPVLLLQKTALLRKYDRNIQKLDEKLGMLVRHRSNATFAGVIDFATVTSVSESLTVYNSDSEKFCRTVTKPNYRFTALKNSYNETKESQERLKDDLKDFSDPSKISSEDRNKIALRINNSLDKITEIDDQIGEAWENFQEKIDEFDAKYEEWKKEQKEKKTKVTIYAVLATFGVLCTFVKAFFPLIDAALNVQKAPVAPAPGQPQS